MTDITEKEATKLAKEAEKEATKTETSDFVVDDPQILRPKELPLVIKPAKGSDWKNPAQAKFAEILNGYAYKNPEKWALKKTALLAQLKALETNPSLIEVLQGGTDENLKFSNKLIQK